MREHASRQIEVCVPAVPLQHRLWHLQTHEGAGAAFNIPVALSLKGRLSAPLLTAAIGRAIERHQSLRAHFEAQGEDLWFVVTRGVEASISRESAAETPHHLLARDAQVHFSLSDAPLYRFSLIQTSDDRYVLCACFHHSVIDGWSVRQLAREIAEDYSASVDGGSAQPIRPMAQFSDFALDLYAQLGSGRLIRSLSYWAKKLEGAQAAGDLVPHRPRFCGFAGAVDRLEVAEELTERLKNVSRRQKSSLFCVLLAAFCRAMLDVTEREDLVIRYPVANRSDPKYFATIGMLANFNALRVKVPPTIGMPELLSYVDAELREAQPHVAAPFEQVVHLLGGTAQDYSRMFQIAFSFFDHASFRRVASVRMSGVQLEFIDVDAPPTARYDLTCEFVSNGSGGLVGLYQYRSALLSSDIVHRVRSSMDTALRRLAALVPR